MIAQTLTATVEGGSLMELVSGALALLGLLGTVWKHFDGKKKKRMLDAAIIGVKAALASLNTEDAEVVKQSIENAAGGKSAPLNIALKEEVRRTTSAMKAFVPAILICLFISGCAGHRAESHEAAVAHQQLLKAIRETSKPVMGVATGKWEAGWNEAERGAALWEEETK